jgi:hypothetical protein
MHSHKCLNRSRLKYLTKSLADTHFASYCTRSNDSNKLLDASGNSETRGTLAGSGILAALDTLATLERNGAVGHIFNLLFLILGGSYKCE